jgi:hypothetical protein
MEGLELGKLLLGQVIEVLPPSDERNFYKYQHVYKVKLKLDLFAQTNYYCIKTDAFGSTVNFKDEILDVGAKVFVTFLNEDFSFGIILGASRFFPSPTDSSLGKHTKTVFNDVEEHVSKEGNYSVKSLTTGVNVQVNTKSIVLDDASGDKITIDKENKKITIQCETWSVEVKGNATINVSKNAEITAKNINVTANGNTNLTSSGVTQVTASLVQINGGSGGVMTDNLNPVVDFITGVPSIGVPNVRSG